MTLFRIFPQVLCPECGVTLFVLPANPAPKEFLAYHTLVKNCKYSGKQFTFEWPTIEGTEVTQ